MTIGIGLICNDGIVLGADTLIEGDTKTYTNKLVGVLLKSPGLTFAVAGAGLAEDVRLLPELLVKRTRSVRTLAGLTSAIDEEVSEFYEKKVWPRPNTHPGDFPNFIIAVRSNEKARVFTTASGALAPVTSPFVCIGSGQAIAEYIASTMFRPSAGYRVAEVLTAYIIKQAKIYGVGVGGDTHIARIPLSGRSPSMMLSKDIVVDEKYFEEFFKAAANLAYLGMKGIPTSAMDKLVDDLKNTVLGLRLEVHRGQIWGDSLEKFSKPQVPSPPAQEEK